MAASRFGGIPRDSLLLGVTTFAFISASAQIVFCTDRPRTFAMAAAAPNTPAVAVLNWPFTAIVTLLPSSFGASVFST